MMLPTFCICGRLVRTKAAEIATSMESAKTTVEWPREKKKPTATGRFPSCINLRVVLSMAAI